MVEYSLPLSSHNDEKKRLNKTTFTVIIGMILLCDHFIEKVYHHSESHITSYLPVPKNGRQTIKEKKKKKNGITKKRIHKPDRIDFIFDA